MDSLLLAGSIGLLEIAGLPAQTKVYATSLTHFLADRHLCAASFAKQETQIPLIKQPTCES